MKVCALVLTAAVLVLASTVAAAPWKFVAVGDSRDHVAGLDGVNTEILGEIATEIVARNAELVMFPGDLVYGYDDEAGFRGELQVWRSTMAPVYNAGIAVYAGRGNHELPSMADGLAIWNDEFPDLPTNGPAAEQRATYSATHKNALIVSLDLYAPGQDAQVNQAWLNQQLWANDQPHVFAFAHEPAFGPRSSRLEMGEHPAERNAFWASLVSANARTYFTGHDHWYEHTRMDDGDADPSNDIHQYIVGTGGAPLRDNSHDWAGPNSPYTPVLTAPDYHYAAAYGYVVGEVDDLDVTLTWMQRTGVGVYTATEQWSYTAAPEPATLSVLAFAGVALLRKRR